MTHIHSPATTIYTPSTEYYQILTVTDTITLGTKTFNTHKLAKLLEILLTQYPELDI